MIEPPPKTQRRLMAVLAADVVASTTMMEADEELAVSAIRSVLSEVVEPAVLRHQGRIVKTLGDGVLAEFASPVEAVLGAVEVQAAMAESAPRAALGEPIRLRIGVNLGDAVVGEDGDIHGDSVNVAVRLQSFADPGGVCVSGKVYDELEGKLSLPFEDRGEQRLKNIARPIRVYALQLGGTSAREPKSARPSLAPADKPSIAVLPFTNLSGDPEQEYLADGLADDILTALAKSRWLFVMARNSSFAFKGKAIETDQIARRLGVRYVLSGSVRRSGSHIRVSAQLIEADTGGSIWAERYDRHLTDIFALQDEIAEEVAGAIEPELLKKEGQRGAERPQSLTAWDLVRRGMWEFHKVRPESHRAARELFRKAIEIDPNSADGYLWLARTEAGLAAYGWTSDPDANLREGMEAALKAVQLDDRNPYCHYAVVVTHAFAGHVEQAIRAARRALALSPSFALGHLILGAAYLCGGRPREAIEPLEHGLRLSPYDPQNFSWFLFLALAYYFAGEPAKGLEDARRALALRPHWAPALTALALCSEALGDSEQARLASAELKTCSASGGDLLRLLGRYNPAWAEQFARVARGDSGE
ncbi:MAG TPA: adenylate/guanylate cyclase domain-containing protein [Microvirga sp.]|nr:adenylate/guanylate cyclase domain-containing protein [Microvirga sp.]